MKKRLLLINLVLVLVMMVLAPAAALAAKPQPFYAGGNIAYITPGDVMPAGNSGRWRVIERELGGALLPEVAGIPTDVAGPFTLTYKANVELATQAGNLHGTLEAGDYTCRVNGKIEPLEFVEMFPGVYLPKLSINGHWTFTGGAKGNGNFDAWVIFIPDACGHIESIIASSFTMDGGWH